MQPGLAENDAAGLDQTFDDRRGVRGDEAAQRAGTRAVGQAGDMNVVLDRQGDAAQGQGARFGVQLLRALYGAGSVDGDESIERRAFGDQTEAALNG